MKIIYDEILEEIIWKGGDYLVLGKPGVLEPHQHLLTVVDSPQPPYDPETHALTHTPHSMVGLEWIDAWETRPLTPEEIESRSSYAAQLHLATARAGMSGLLSTLIPASRAKFATARAGIELLLDLGDIEAAHVAIDQQSTDTPEESAVKNTLLAALSAYLPAQ